MATNVFDLVGKIYLDGGDKVKRELDDIDGGAEKSGGKLGKLGKVFGVIGSAAAAGAVALGTAAVAIGKVGIGYNIMKEQSTAAWKTLLGTQAEAEAQMKRIATFAKETQFDSSSVDAMAKFLHNAGLEGKALFDELNKVADVAGAFNLTAESATELTRQMSQVRQAGVAYTEDLNILADRGVPIYKALSEQLGITVADVKKMASEGKISSEIYLGAFDNIATGVKGAAEAQSQTIGGMVSTMQDNFQILAGTITEGLMPHIKTAMNFINNLMEGITAAIGGGEGGGGVTAAVDKLKNVFQGVLDFMSPIIETMKNAFNELVAFFMTKILPDVQGFIESIRVFWEENGEQIMEAVQNFVDFISEIMKFLWPFVKALIVDTWNSIKSIIQGSINVIQGIIKVFTGVFTGDWSKVWEGIKQIVSGALEAVWGWIELTLLGKILKGVKLFGDLAKAPFKALFDFAKGQFDNLLKAGQTIITNLMNAFKKVIPNFQTIGKQLIDGLVNGIKSSVSKVVNAASDLGKKALSSFKKVFDIGSPSRVTSYFGQMLGEGLTGGMEDTEGGVVSQAKSIAAQVLDALKAQFSPSANLMGATVGAEASSANLGASGAFGGGGGGILRIEVPLYVNGREVARTITDDIDYLLERKRQITSRSRGLVK